MHRTNVQWFISWLSQLTDDETGLSLWSCFSSPTWNSQHPLETPHPSSRHVQLTMAIVKQNEMVDTKLGHVGSTGS
ncbi:BgTH12-04669 [Blumeria graminis f. sp. triticale]|uniref:BgTH12-04669 n=1 Tax=Blumeria graminis f. sp. triticale TaxID=1689686 RepID=A0A9W4CUS3_BLUGR|nr:BgTH12-04669 [Blumeria graminis f. sp. triticale]